MTFRENSNGFRDTIFIRIAVGLIFFTQGILKYTDAKMGVERFARIGFPYPAFTAHFVGTFEIVCGLLVLAGLWTRSRSPSCNHLQGHRNHEDCRVDTRWPGILVHGE